MKASRSTLTPMAHEPPLAFERLGRIFSFFSKVSWASWWASLVSYAVALTTLSYCPLASGQVITKAASAPDQSPLRYVNRSLPKWLRVSGEFRNRAEGRTAFGFRNGSDDAYDLTRFRVNLEISLRKWVTVFTQGQDGRALGIDPSRLSPALKDVFDLRQAYVELKTGEKDGVSLRVGRQDLIFGSERLVGALDWGTRLAVSMQFAWHLCMAEVGWRSLLPRSW